TIIFYILSYLSFIHLLFTSPQSGIVPGRQNTVMRRHCAPEGEAQPPHDGILPAMPLIPRPESEWYSQRDENPAGFSPPAGALRGLAGYRQGLSDTGP
ncbi:MAG: hypothetical protein LBK66_10890, partial [Spirochaetaceae bacterium]|nr:hypothetical protein [Spirochaetaceae bacterium]